MARARIVLLACLVGLLGGCAPATQLATNQARDYKGNPKRIYVVFHSIDEFGSTFDKNEYLTAVKAFGPDALLVVRRAGGTKSAYGQLIHVVLNAELVDVAVNRTVWRAKVDFYRGGTLIPIDQRAEALATDINGKLKADGVLKCGSPGGSTA